MSKHAELLIEQKPEKTHEGIAYECNAPQSFSRTSPPTIQSLSLPTPQLPVLYTLVPLLQSHSSEAQSYSPDLLPY